MAAVRATHDCPHFTDEDTEVQIVDIHITNLQAHELNSPTFLVALGFELEALH
jgi:hypothetical protein